MTRPLLLALAATVLLSAQPANAQWAVIDPAHIVKSVYNGFKIVDQLNTQRQQLADFQRQVEGLARFEFRSVGQFTDHVDRTLASGQSLAYSTRELDAAFADAYADYGATSPSESADAFVQRRLDGALQTLRALRESAEQISGARGDIERLQGQIRSATTSQQIAEVQGTIEAYQAQELQMLRQAVMLQASQTATDQAEEAARFAYSREQTRQRVAAERARAAARQHRSYDSPFGN
ncbi:MAG: type IV secretion system protein [Bacteroidota bacterium]